MKNRILLLLVLGMGLLTSSCFKDRDDKIKEPGQADTHNFVYEGLKLFYLYKNDTEALDNQYFADNIEKEDFLSNFQTPESLFDFLLSPRDRFSIIVPDFYVLEELLSGISMNNGMEYGLVQISSSGEIFGYVRYVLPNTSAEEQGVQRGMLFNRVDGITLDTNNYRDLLQPDEYTIGLAALSETALVSLDEEISLTKTGYTENPVYLNRVIDTLGHKIGYLMYNSFTNNFDDQLNAVFGHFEGEGITDLVLDLRYNGGGSIETCKDLSSMITGQFTDQLFATEEFNENFDDRELFFDTRVISGATINSLHLNRVFVLTTQSTASASELLINGLNPYIEVVQIGGTTIGKFEGSITVYDSPDFSRAAVQPGHTYAMQPLVLKTVNSVGFTDFADGLDPDYEYFEDYRNLGVLGNPQEPMLQLAISNILGAPPSISHFSHDDPENFIPIGERKMDQLSFQRMYTSEK